MTPGIRGLLALLALAASGSALADTTYFYCFARGEHYDTRYYSEFRSTEAPYQDEAVIRYYSDAVFEDTQREHPDGEQVVRCVSGTDRVKMQQSWTAHIFTMDATAKQVEFKTPPPGSKKIE